MKKIILAAALAAISLASAAGTVGHMPNKAGGRIQLTDGSSERCRELSKTTGRTFQYAVTTAPDGSTAKGCWVFNKDDDQIEIRWGADLNYDTSLFDQSSFTRTEYNERVYGTGASKPRRAASASEREI